MFLECQSRRGAVAEPVAGAAGRYRQMGRQAAAIFRWRHAAAQSEVAMETIFVYWLPLVLNIVLAVFLRTCWVTEAGNRIPRGLSYLLALLGFIPIGAWVVFVIALYITVVNWMNDNINLKENKFTRYWFKS